MADAALSVTEGGTTACAPMTCTLSNSAVVVTPVSDAVAAMPTCTCAGRPLSVKLSTSSQVLPFAEV